MIKEKYGPLKTYLDNQLAPLKTVTLSFADVEKIIGQKLPKSARNHRTWWGNVDDIYASQARGWLNAGFKVDMVDTASKRVRFKRIRRKLRTVVER